MRKFGVSLDELNAMTWREFQIRSAAFKLEEEQRIEETQWMVWNIRWAPHLDPKELPNTFDKYKNEGKLFDGGKKALALYESAMDEYLKAQKKNGGS